MGAGKFNLGIVCMMIHTVVYSIVKKEIPKFAIIIDNLKDVNLQ